MKGEDHFPQGSVKQKVQCENRGKSRCKQGLFFHRVFACGMVESFPVEPAAPEDDAALAGSKSRLGFY